MKNKLKIKFVGKKLGVEPLPFITDGNTRIDLPQNQSRPFSHEHAKRILQVQPELYKRVVPKGAK